MRSGQPGDPGESREGRQEPFTGHVRRAKFCAGTWRAWLLSGPASGREGRLGSALFFSAKYPRGHGAGYTQKLQPLRPLGVLVSQSRPGL